MEAPKEERINLVDGTGARVGEIGKLDAHVQGRLHEAFSIFIFDGNGRMMLQRRAARKYHSGGLWTNACCSHPRVGELVEEAIHRRLVEEMGFDCELRESHSFIYKVTFDNGLTEHEYDRVFVGLYAGDPILNPEEADAWAWREVGDIALQIEREPEAFTFWFKAAFADAVVAAEASILSRPAERGVPLQRGQRPAPLGA